jgi:hypothetical protein
VRLFEDGIDHETVDDFLTGADLYVDGLDTFAVDARQLVFARCRALGIPALTAAPLGMGVAYLLFTPGSMSFERYFGWSGQDRREKLHRFIEGLAPRGAHRTYLVQPERLDMDGERAPSTPMACELCAGVVGTEAVKLLLGRGELRPAPHYQQFDAYRGRWLRGKLRGGHRNPRQRLRQMRRQLAARPNRHGADAAAPDQSPRAASDMEKILDLARWAPSGDNNQPWRFAVVDDDHVEVHLHLPEGDVYDRDGEFTLLSGGFLLETMRLAASRFGRTFRWTQTRVSPHLHRIDVAMPKDPSVSEDPRTDLIRVRSVDRRPYRTTPLTQGQKRALEAALGDMLQVRWLESIPERWRLIRLSAMGTDIRLRIPEAFEVHRRILDFGKHVSTTGIPGPATGLDRMTLRAMRWAFRDFRHVDRMNRWLGTGAPQLEMDLLPGLACGAQFLVAWNRVPEDMARETALLTAGEHLQRMWLEATRLGLAMQPNLAPIAFARYGQTDAPFTQDASMRGRARELAGGVDALWAGQDAHTLTFAGRIGVPQSRRGGPRSVRRPLASLLVRPHACPVVDAPAPAEAAVV